MAIYGVGAYYYGTTDVSPDFINNNIIGTGWTKNQAPELHSFFGKIKVGDIVYIKSAHQTQKNINIKAIGIVKDEVILDSNFNNLTSIGRNVKWINTNKFSIPKPIEKNNVRSNTVYEEYHPEILIEIIKRVN